VELRGSGWFAARLRRGPAVLIEVHGEETLADPQAAITWSTGLTTLGRCTAPPAGVARRAAGKAAVVGALGGSWAVS
jgi:hypothetical protein